MTDKKQLCIRCKCEKENPNIKYCNKCNKENVLKHTLRKLNTGDIQKKIEHHRWCIYVHNEVMQEKEKQYEATIL
jgi:hypothetical protein